jgi:hypothetical protein
MYNPNEETDPLDDDRDQNNPNEMDAEDWHEFYGDTYRRTGMDYEEYLDNDHSMDY